MSRALEILTARLANSRACKVEAQNDLAAAHRGLADLQRVIADADTTIADIEAAIITLGGKVEPAVIKTLARTKVEGY